jgi:hypothetical protein
MYFAKYNLSCTASFKNKKMETIIIELKNSKALKLIEDLEALSLVRIVREPKAVKGKKLSERLVGAISSKEASDIDKELEQIRSEWKRSS